MTTRTKVPCGYPGCAALVPPNSGGCEKHKRERWKRQNYKRRTDVNEAKLDRFYSGATWQKLRGMHIRNNPLCVHCGAVARVVDHIQPRRNGGADLDIDNLQSLCLSCHAIKTKNERS